MRGCGASSRDAHGSPADRITEWKKIFCCVTTRRRNFWTLKSLRRGLRSLSARFFGLGMPGFGFGVLAGPAHTKSEHGPDGTPSNYGKSEDLALCNRNVSFIL